MVNDFQVFIVIYTAACKQINNTFKNVNSVNILDVLEAR